MGFDVYNVSTDTDEGDASNITKGQIRNIEIPAGIKGGTDVSDLDILILMQALSESVIQSGQSSPSDSTAEANESQFYIRYNSSNEVVSISFSPTGENTWSTYTLPMGGGVAADGVVTGGSVSGTTLTLERSVGADIDIPGLPSGGGTPFGFSAGEDEPDNADANMGENQIYWRTNSSDELTGIYYSPSNDDSWQELAVAMGGGGTGFPFSFQSDTAPAPDVVNAVIGRNELFFTTDGSGNLTEISFSSRHSDQWTQLPIAMGGGGASLAGIPGLGSPPIDKTLRLSGNRATNDILLTLDSSPGVNTAVFENVGSLQYPPGFFADDLLDTYFYLKGSASGAIRTGPIDRTQASGNVYTLDFSNIEVSGSEIAFTDGENVNVGFQQAPLTEDITAIAGVGAPDDADALIGVNQLYFDTTGAFYYSLFMVDAWTLLPISSMGTVTSTAPNYRPRRNYAINELAVYLGTLYRASMAITDASTTPSENNSGFAALFAAGISDVEASAVSNQFLRWHFSTSEHNTISQIDIEDDDYLRDNGDGTVTVVGSTARITITGGQNLSVVLHLLEPGPETRYPAITIGLAYQIDDEPPVIIRQRDSVNHDLEYQTGGVAVQLGAFTEAQLTMSSDETLRVFLFATPTDSSLPPVSIFQFGSGSVGATYSGSGAIAQTHLILQTGHITAVFADGTTESLLSLSGVPQGPFEAHLGSRTFRTAFIYREFDSEANIVPPTGGTYDSADELFTVPTGWVTNATTLPGEGIRVVSLVELYHNDTIRYLNPIALPTGEGIDDATLALDQRRSIPISAITIPDLDSIIRYSSWESLDGDVDTELFRVRYQENAEHNGTELMITGVTDGNIVVTNRHGVLDEYDWARKIRALRIARSYTGDIYIFIGRLSAQTRNYDPTEPQPDLPYNGSGHRLFFATVPAGSNFPVFDSISPAGLPAFKADSDSETSYDRGEFDMERLAWAMFFYGRATADNGRIVAGDINTYPSVRFEGDGLATHTNQDPSNNSIDADIRQWATFGIASLPTAQSWEIYHDNQSLLLPVGESLHQWQGLEVNTRDAEFTDLVIAFPNTEPTSAFEAMVGGREDALLAGQLLRRPEIDYTHDLGAQQWQEAAGQGLEANDYVTRGGLALRANAPTTAPDSTENFEETDELEKVYAHGAKSLPESLTAASGEFRFGVRPTDPITFSANFHQVFEATDNPGEFRAKIAAQFTMDAVSYEFGVVRGQAGGNNLRITDVQFSVIRNGSRQIIAQNTDSVNTDRYQTYRRTLVGGIFTLNVVVGDLIRFDLRVLPNSVQQYVNFETFDFRWTGSVNATVGHEVIAESSPQEQWGFTRDNVFYPVFSSTGEILADSHTFRQLETLLVAQRGRVDVYGEGEETSQGVLQLFLRHLLWSEQADPGDILPTDDTNDNFVFPVVQRIEGFGHESPSMIHLRLNPHRWNDDTNNVQSLVVGPGLTADVDNLTVTIGGTRAAITLPMIDSNYTPGRGLRIHNDNAEELTLTVYFRYQVDDGPGINYCQVNNVVVPANGNILVQMESAGAIGLELEHAETLQFYPALSVPETDDLYIEGEDFNLLIPDDSILIEYEDGAGVDAARDGNVGIVNPVTGVITDVFDRDGNLLGPSAQDFARGIPKWMLGLGTTQGQFVEFARQFWEVLQTNPGITIPSRAPDTYAGIGARFIGRPRHDVAGVRADVDFRQLHWTQAGHSSVVYSDPTTGAYLTYDSATQTLTCEGAAAQISVVPIVASDSRNRFRLVSFGSHIPGIEYMRFTTSLNGEASVTRQEHVFDPPFTVLGAQSSWFDLLGPDVVQVFEMAQGDTLRLAFELNHPQSDTGLVVSPDFRFRFDVTAYSDDGYRFEAADGNKLVSIDEQQEIQTETVIWRPQVAVEFEPNEDFTTRAVVTLPEDYLEFDKVAINLTGLDAELHSTDIHLSWLTRQFASSFSNVDVGVVFNNASPHPQVTHFVRLVWDIITRELTFEDGDVRSRFTSVILDG